MQKLVEGAEQLGLHLSPSQIEQYEVYYRELVEWNSRVNLTAITAYEDVQVKHFLDSLSIILVMERQRLESGPFRAIDVGSGAGIPGLPLKLAFPCIELTLLDSVAKKSAFISYVLGRLGVEGVEVVTGRAEGLAHQEHYREGFDLVLSRGVARLSTLVELTLPLCRVGGRFVAQKKGEISEEVTTAANAISLLGGSLREIRKLDLEGLRDRRCLVVIDKVSLTPAKYPRRPGIPEKRPL